MAEITAQDLGNTYRDPISGWEGVATARYEYLNGCVRVELSAADKDGKPDSFVFDHEQLVQVVGSDKVADIPEPARRTGGPRSSTPVPR